MTYLKNSLLICVLLILVLPVCQLRWAVIPETPLKGYFSQSSLPDLKYFTWTRWFSQDFQQLVTTRLNENTGFRSSLIRVRNQYDWSFFGFTHAKGFLSGKERYLYEEDYIREFTGQYFIGERPIDKKMHRLKDVMDSLRSYNIPLILVFEPGKASYFPEYIPDTFLVAQPTITNYDLFSRKASELGMNCIDLNRYFKLLKDTVKYPLFPKNGMHWSLYGVQVAADTLNRYIGAATGQRMPDFTPESWFTSRRPLDTDNDIGDLLNLVCSPGSPSGLYPRVPFDSMPDGNLPALIIADSYYINLVETYGKKMFGKQDYWYYNASLYPHQNETPTVSADKSNLREKLKQYKVILLMVSEINLHCCFWGFADEAFAAFHPEMKDTQLERIENSIRGDREWFRFMVIKSRNTKKPLDDVIRADAEYAFQSNFPNLENKVLADTLQSFRINLAWNPNWVKGVKRKAWARNIPVDSMMLIEARQTYEQSKKKQ